MNPTGYQTIQQFARQDPELTYAVLRDSWPRLKDPNVRTSIVTQILQGTGSRMVNGVEVTAYSPSPHLLDILGIALESAEAAKASPAPGARPQWEAAWVRQELLGISFREISTTAEFAEWRKSVGAKPLTETIQENSRRIVSELETGTDERRRKILDALRQLTFYNGTGTNTNNGVVTHSYYASGLMSIRREALIAANLAAALGKLLQPEMPPDIRQQSVRALAKFRPDDSVLAKYEKDLRRELPSVMEMPAEKPDPRNPFRQRENLADLLAAFTGDWAADLFAKLMQKGADGGSPDYSAVNSLQYFRNPRIIPTLIGLVDVADTARLGFNPYENALRQIAQIGMYGGPGDRQHDELWWHVWWHDNKKRYSPEVQALPIPRFHKTRTAVNIPLNMAATHRRLERTVISEDPDRTYWLIAPGSPPPAPLTINERDAIANSGLKKLAQVKQDRPGVIVALLDGDTEDPALLDSWLDISDALSERYYVAIAIRPRRGSAVDALWLTRKESASTPTAISTETFAEQIVQQLRANYAIDGERIYLLADGKAGTAGYACALQKETVFRGFGLLSAPFRSALLPPLDAARNRRFFLALGLQGGGASDALASAAEPILKQHGALVQAERVKTGTLSDAVQNAVRWLSR